MLANDTGPLHLAAALGRPVVAPVYLHRSCSATVLTVRWPAPWKRGVGCQGSYLKPLRSYGLHDRADARFGFWPILQEALRPWENNSPFRLILASGSPARRELLTRSGYPFDVRPADIDEPTGAGCAIRVAFVQDVAWRKAAAVADPK